MGVWIAIHESDQAYMADRVRVVSHQIQALPVNAEGYEVVQEFRDYEAAHRAYRKFLFWLQKGAHGCYVFGVENG